MDKQMWLVYAVLAGLSWGTYVPMVQQGIAGLGRNAFASFLCVGVAYFLIAVLIPIGMFMSGLQQPQWNAYGITFATLAGVAGALGALFVIFANRSVAQTFDRETAQQYRLYIAPIIFALAPVLNAVVSTLWHPNPATGAFNFGIHFIPNWKYFLGIVLAGAGAALVLYSKEESEVARPGHAPAPAPKVEAPAPVNPGTPGDQK